MADVSATRFAFGEFRIGAVFTRTWSVFWRNILTFTVVSGIAALPTLLLPRPGAGDLVANQQLIFLRLAVMLLLNMLAQAFIFYCAFQDMRGRPINMGDSLKLSLARFFPLIGLGLIVVLVMIGLVVIVSLLLFAVAGSGATALTVIPFVILLVILFTLRFLIWSMATPVCVVERAGPFRSLRRSRELTKGYRWKILGLLALVIIPGLVVGVIVGAIAGAVAALAPAGGASVAVSQGIGLIWNALWFGFVAVIFAVAYHDLRVAKEGVDIDQIAAVFE